MSAAPEFVFNPFTGNFDAVTDPSANPFTLDAICLAGDAVGDCVRISGDSIGGYVQVTKVDVTDPTKMPAIGVIIAKPSSTNATVAWLGVITGTGFTPNARYFVSNTGQLTPTPPTVRPAMYQVMAQAIDSQRLILLPSRDMTRVI